MTFAFLIEALGIAPNASQNGYTIDSVLEMVHWFMLVLFVGWGTFYFYTLWRFRQKKSPKADYTGATSHLPTKLEGGVLVLEVVLLMAFAAPIWAHRVDQIPSGPDVIHVVAVGQQFQWDLQYTGPDGKFGRRDISLVSASNALGLDRKDPDAQDDLMAVNEMHLPVNRPVVITVMSKDVIHDFCIPNMRVATDAIPGTKVPLWFIPVKTGTYEIVCAQLCGTNHAYMKGTLVVESEADYEKWFNETAKLSGAKVADDKLLTPTTTPVPASSPTAVVQNH